MLLPSIFGESLLDDLMDMPRFEFPDIDRKLYGKNATREMKTDVHEHDDHYEVDIDLPGFKKDELTLELDNGYLTVSAAKGLDKTTENKGKVIRQERYAGALRRSFYVGENLTVEDISAKFENGVLSLNVPKKEHIRLPEHKRIEIE